jgi:hypothetical protein
MDGPIFLGGALPRSPLFGIYNSEIRIEFPFERDRALRLDGAACISKLEYRHPMAEKGGFDHAISSKYKELLPLA